MPVSRDELVEALADGLHQAARVSIARGEQYVQGEQVNTDAVGAWRAVASALVKVVEKVIDERQPKPEVEKRDVERT